MHVFVLGGTGTIGSAVVAELVDRNHQVLALSRSEPSDTRLRAAGATPLRGDLTRPRPWVDAALSCDAIIQVAATFGDDMGDVDACAMNALIAAAAQRPAPTRLIYTGGCWLYGETGDRIASEHDAFDPLPAFAWMVKHADRLLRAPNLRTAILHPAMVYDMRDGGVFHRFLSDAQAGHAMTVWGSPQTRWPLIASTDLARAYCDLLDHPDLTGHFNAVAQEGVYVDRIIQTIAAGYGTTNTPILRSVHDVVAQYGDWAKGPTLDQQMSAQKLCSATGWRPQITDFTRAIQQWITRNPPKAH